MPSATFPAMEFERLQELYNRCNPDEPLSPGDARNVDITTSEKEREAADHLLQNNVILRYLNDDEWVDLHPSVAGMQELAGPSPDANSAAEEASVEAEKGA